MLKISVRKAEPKEAPKLKKNEAPDPTLELEQDCSHVAVLEIEGQKTKRFPGSSVVQALQTMADHITFCAKAYAYVLLPEKPRTPAKMVAIERQMAAAGLQMPKQVK